MYKQAENRAPDQIHPKISNRESKRLEFRVTPTKQTTDPNSNREKETLFQATHPTISNRETNLLETPVNPTKQRVEVLSNREKNGLFT